MASPSVARDWFKPSFWDEIEALVEELRQEEGLTGTAALIKALWIYEDLDAYAEDWNAYAAVFGIEEVLL